MPESDVTGLEKLENAADNMPAWGNPGTFGAADHVLLERSGTNKVTAGSGQSELRISWLFLHAAFVARDNILIVGGSLDGYGLNDHRKHYREIPDPSDPKGGRRIRQYFQVDYWAWMIPIIDDNVIEHQLTLWGYSREQFMRHAIAIGSINQRDESEPAGMWQQITQIFKRGI